MIINHLTINISTPEGPYGIEIPFSPGLFVLRVHNTFGKSSCMNAIAYALGMERALGVRGGRTPFPPALRQTLENSDGNEIQVLSSEVALRISANSGQAATLTRQIVGSGDENVIRVVEHTPGGGSEQLKFLHREGDTTRADGFYAWLCDFLGWKLPEVPNHRGGESILYPSVFFPAFFVEQKKGWSSLLGTTPTIFGIKEPKKRAIEFVLDLDVTRVLKKRALLNSELDEVLVTWKQLHRQFEDLAVSNLGHASGLTERPAKAFDPYKLDILVEERDTVNSIQLVIDQLEKELRVERQDLEDGAYLESADQLILASLRDKMEKRAQIETELLEASEQESFLHSEVLAAETRKASLLDQKRKYEDLRKLSSVKELSSSSISEDTCPTCGQEIGPFISELNSSTNILSFEDSLQFIRNQIKTCEGLLLVYNERSTRIKASLSAKKHLHEQLSEDISAIRGRTFSSEDQLRTTKIRKLVNLEDRIERYRTAIRRIADFRNQFSALKERYASLAKQRRDMPESGLTVDDEAKLNFLQSTMVGLLEKFQFSSFSPNNVEISRETYLPTRESYDIAFDTSASDSIRIIWAYLLALMATAREFQTPHLGLVVLDEPRQQEAENVSFAGLLREASRFCGHDQQVILATSEDLASLKAALGTTEHTLLSFAQEEGKLIRPL